LWKYDLYSGAVVSVIPVGDDSDETRRETSDWIAWSRRIDPVFGNSSTAADQNITHSALTRYLGAQRKDHKTYAEANTIDSRLEAVFRCPSDTLEGRPSAGDASHGYYRYSYAMNIAYTNGVG